MSEFNRENSIPVGDQCDVVAVKCEDGNTDCYSSHSEAADAGTVGESSRQALKVKSEPMIDIDCIKEECGSDTDAVEDFKVEEEIGGRFRSVGDIKCEVRRDLNCMRIGVRSADAKAGGAAHGAERETYDMSRYDSKELALGSCSDSIDKCGMSEENMGGGRDAEISVDGLSRAQTRMIKTYITSDTVSVDAGAFVSLGNGELHLKSEEIDLGCDAINASSHTEDDYEESNTHTCKVCHKNFSRPSHLKLHMRTHTLEKPHVCNICDKKFSRKFVLDRHMLTHRDKPHTCEICDKKFTYISNFKHHMLIHSDDKPRICNICYKKFARKSDFDNHMLTHTSCNICGKKFSRKSNLKKHMLTHTGEEPHTCEICEKKFSVKRNFTQHMLIHTGERPHICNVCDRKFANKSNLNQHMFTHNGDKPHVCKICEKKFSLRASFKKHMLTHTGDKPHTCQICDSKFSLNYRLKRHMRRHSGQKPHTCAICETKFFEKAHLNRHMLRKHIDEKPHIPNVT